RPRHPGWLDHGTGPACRSSLGGSTDTVTEGVEVLGIRGPGRGGLRTLQQDVPQMLPVLVLTDQLTHVLTTRAVALLGDLFLDECLERVRQGDVHRAHGSRLASLAKIAKDDDVVEVAKGSALSLARGAGWLGSR